MKQIRFVNILFLVLLTVLATGCLNDGDETVSLEYGNPKKIIVGTWKVMKHTPQNGYSPFKPGATLIFQNDGTFTNSLDDCDCTHEWVLGNYNDGEPYNGNITLDGIDYEIVSLGGDGNDDGGGHGYWVLGKPNDDSDGYQEYWEFEKDSSGLGDSSDMDEPSGGIGKLVSKISIYTNTVTTPTPATTRATSEQTIKFYYDDTNRVTSVECSGNLRLISGLKNGTRLFYEINDNEMTLYSSTGNSAKQRGDGSGAGFGYGILNDMGYLEYDCLNNTQQAMNTGNYSYAKFSYIDGQTISMNSADFIWENGDILWGLNTGTLERYGYIIDKENKANINLNRLFTHTYERDGGPGYEYKDVYALALCGYIGNKDMHLLSYVSDRDYNVYAKLVYKFDSEGYPEYIDYFIGDESYSCIIEYTQDNSLTVLPKY